MSPNADLFLGPPWGEDGERLAWQPSSFSGGTFSVTEGALLARGCLLLCALLLLGARGSGGGRPRPARP